MAEETFTMLPLSIDPQTKLISPVSHARSVPSTLTKELEALNSLHKHVISLNTPHQTPPAPLPIDPKRSQQITKMREQGNHALSRRVTSGTKDSASINAGHFNEAIRLYNFALDMAVTRPPWEPSNLVREEASLLLSNRAQAYIGLQQWADAAVDAEMSIECKAAPGQGKAWWRRGRCLMQLGRWDEARAWVARGMSIEQNDGANELKGLMEEIEGHFKALSN